MHTKHLIGNTQVAVVGIAAASLYTSNTLRRTPFDKTYGWIIPDEAAQELAPDHYGFVCRKNWVQQFALTTPWYHSGLRV